eukprot:TRINITY_DN15823_c0_g1_i1.p1 TRINITY_DN15823_c0_g1~~TRINITY_DN15823_c0_g1_i1.p1  ORF type:complete len:619 (-),score=178.56 TRINITY_DN15823_c0_g1_i1:25-1821(-)
MEPVAEVPYSRATTRRTHTCGELRQSDVGKEVTLCGWVQVVRDKQSVFISLRDRYGITQIFVDCAAEEEILKQARSLGREFVISVTGKVIERAAKNPNMDTGDIEVVPSKIETLSPSLTPPFKIEDKTDGLEELRMKHRYLDIRRNPVRDSLLLRHKVAQAVRKYLSDRDFVEVETPVLIKSTPEGARDFIVPSRMNPGTFYALPQSPQTFKQILMVAGIDRYFQIAKCFRDEELRADRQPEFTQIDCEMSFVTQEDILNMFEGFMKSILKEIKGIEFAEDFPRMTYADAMKYYGIDKPDIRFDMKLVELNELAKGKGFGVFDNAELIVGICAPGMGSINKSEITKLTTLCKSSEIGTTGLIWIKAGPEPTSSVDKFYTKDDLTKICEAFNANAGDMIFIFSGKHEETQTAMGRFRNHIGSRLNLRDPAVFKPLWVVDFPLLEWLPEENRWQAMHHPFTSPMPEDIPLLDTEPGKARAVAYDLVLNGVEVGGGSIRIHQKEVQQMMFKHLGFTPESAEEQFGFLMKAFEYGAPPHGGIAFGLDRLCTLLGGVESIRNFIAFPKNNQGRDTMIDAPSTVSQAQLTELNIDVVKKEKAGQ